MELYKIVFKNVQEIINANDPVGLVSGDAPDDEYDAEVSKIVILLRDGTDKISLAVEIGEIFKASFGDVDIQINRSQCRLIAGKLLEIKNRFKW